MRFCAALLCVVGLGTCGLSLEGWAQDAHLIRIKTSALSRGTSRSCMGLLEAQALKKSSSPLRSADTRAVWAVWKDALLERGSSYGEFLVLRQRWEREGRSEVRAQIGREIQEMLRAHLWEWLPPKIRAHAGAILVDGGYEIRGLSFSQKKSYLDFLADGGVEAWNALELDTLEIAWLDLRGQEAVLPLTRLHTLKTLSIGGNFLSEADIIVLSRIPQLTFLDLSSNRFEGEQKLGALGLLALTQSLTLTHLRLSSNALSAAEVAALSGSRTLTHLDLQSTNLDCAIFPCFRSLIIPVENATH